MLPSLRIVIIRGIPVHTGLYTVGSGRGDAGKGPLQAGTACTDAGGRLERLAISRLGTVSLLVQQFFVGFQVRVPFWVKVVNVIGGRLLLLLLSE